MVDLQFGFRKVGNWSIPCILTALKNKKELAFRTCFKVKSKIVVKHGEDLLSPNDDTVDAIEGVRHDGCETYVILLGNPYQAVRLLMFGDKTRVLDTSARYIMLHDYKLLAPDAHYLWYRIVRVIFIRRFSKKSNAWYELSTVPYPVKVKGILVLKKLDYWRKGNGLRNNVDLFRDKTRNLLGLPMSVAILNHLPAVKRLSKTEYIGNTRETKTITVYTGLEIELVRALARAMNFTLQLYEPANADTEMWGRKDENGTYSGILGEMVGGYADFAVADLHYTQYNLQYMDLSLPYGTECLTFLTPEALFDNSWMTLILPFKPMMWLAVMIALFFLGFIFFGLAKYQMHLQVFVQKMDEDEKVELKDEDELRGLYVFGEMVNSILYTFSMLLVVSLPTLPSGWSLRMLTGWYWLYCVLVAVSYRASLTAILANPAPRIRIDTLEQLSKSPISAGGWGDQHKQFFVTSLDEYGRNIGRKFEDVDNATEAVDRVARGEFAYYENKHFLRELIVEKQRSNRELGISNIKEVCLANQRSLHIMDNCVINMPVSIGLQKNSPLLQRSDRFLRRAIETGLAEKWLSDVTEPLKAAQAPSQTTQDILENVHRISTRGHSLSLR
ncbi:uncharacterized protein LOC113385888 [Ctenocephalides felis]|uniref:uncharacterized protein LOC113385888 n=1 Tax=Ctenocephalides felis TaxID=7515 RepID=UPI000E6E1FEE|nr:uncharacterized protein LOC113385888 [Ctenocephalides felis]